MREKTKKGLFLVALLAVCLLAFCACGDNNTGKTTVAETKTTVAATTVPEVKTTTAANTVPEKAETHIVKDFGGTDVELPVEIKSIVNNWPSSNSVLLLSGAGEKLVSIPTAVAGNAWAKYMFPYIADLPNVTDNVEEVIKLNPDVYFNNNAETAKTARDAGLPVAFISYNDYGNMKTTFKIIGEIIGGECQENLDKWCVYVDEWINLITDRLKDVKEEDRPVLYYIGAMGNSELTSSMASNSICKTWTNVLGCTYLHDLSSDPNASSLSVEEILKINPDIIVVNGLYQTEAWDKLQKDELFADTKAMKNGKAYLAPVGVFPWTRFGFESAVLLPWLATTLYPEKFADIDIYQVVHDFYKDFSNVELTNADIANIFRGYAPGDPYGAEEAARVEAAKAIPTASGATHIVKDGGGNEIELPVEINSIVNNWPSSNSVLLLSGAGEKLVSIPTAVAGNAWAKYMFPYIADLPNETDNIEEVMKLNPDVYFINNADNAKTARDAGLPAAFIMYNDYGNMKTTFKIIGEIIGGQCQENLDKWCVYVDEWISLITDRLKDVKEEDRPVLYYVGAMSNGELTSSMASNSICKTWTNVLGCTYLHDLTANPQSASLSVEEILKINPDIIVVNGLHQDTAWENLQKDELFADTKAMKNGKAYLAPVGVFPWTRFGFESAVLLPWLATTLYPEKFADIDIYQVVHDFYKDFSNVELTNADIANIFRGYAPGDPYGAEATK